MKTERLVLSAGAIVLFTFLLLAVPGSASAESEAPIPAPGPGKVTLPLRDYLALIEKVESLDHQRERETAGREAPLAEVVAQRTAVVVGAESREAELSAHYEVLVQGRPKEPLLLPFRGLASRAEVSSGPAGSAGTSGGAVSAASDGRGLLLVAPTPGRYTVDVHGRAALEDQGGVRRLTLAPLVAAVAEITVELPADLTWRSPGAVVVEDRVTGGRRAVRLAVHRGQSPVVEIQRQLSGTEAEKLLAQSVVLTLFQLRPEGLRRHDVVLYEVSRGSLANLAVDLPADLAVEQVATDEGDVVPVVEARHLTVHRQRQLQGIGYLVLSSTPPEGATTLPASAVTPASSAGLPALEVRARYLAVASSVAANVQPTPAASWSRVDLSDLPPALGEALQSLDLNAAWRLDATAGGSTVALAVSYLPASTRLPTLVRERETTTLVTVDGTVLHRDRFTLDQAGAALDLTLPAGAVLWSAKVGEQPVRPVARGAVLSVPLGFATKTAPPVVEVVSVLERTIPKGRSDLALALPQVAAPVVLHQWRLLLPDGARYRFKSGDLRPARGRASASVPLPVRVPTPADFSAAKPSGHGPGGGAGLGGKLVDDRGTPLPGATIEVSGEGLTRPVVALTGTDGTFLLSDMPPGRYAVSVLLEGFEGANLVVQIPAGEIAGFAVTLNPAVEETITVVAESPLLDERKPADGEKRNPSKKDKAESYDFDAFEEMAVQLKNGLVGGVKPLPVSIPETGKLLLLTGALPPARVAVELEVKGKN